MVIHLQSNRVNRMTSYVTSLSKQSHHCRESSSKQCQGMFQRSLNLSNRTFKIDTKILDLLRRFKAALFQSWNYKE